MGCFSQILPLTLFGSTNVRSFEVKFLHMVGNCLYGTVLYDREKNSKVSVHVPLFSREYARLHPTKIQVGSCIQLLFDRFLFSGVQQVRSIR